VLPRTKSLRSVGAIALVVLGYLVSEASPAQSESPSTPSEPADAQRAAPTQSESSEAAPAADIAASTQDEPINLEEVIVTARKQAESLQEVPLSIAAVSGDQLEQRSIENLEALGRTTPNFHFSEQPNGGRLGGIAFIRGVGQRDANSAYDPAVGIYVDGIYMGRSYASNMDMIDIERVEVLRGPQGTLFGKNTSGGAISIVTRQPDISADALSGRVQVTSGSFDRADFAGSVNIPLATDRLALRLAGSRLTKDGYGERVDGQEMADTNRTAARAQLRFQATQKLSALLSGDWMDFDEKNASYKLVDVNTSVGPVAAYNANFDPDYDDRWLSSRDYFFNATGPNSARGNIWGSSLTLAYDTSWATLKSITAYREMDVHNDVDTDGSPITIVDKLEHLIQNQVSQELQAAGSSFGDRLRWVVGVYFFQEEIDNPTTFPLFPALYGNAASFTRVYGVDNDSLAVFAQGTYEVTDRLRLTTGLRYTQDDKAVDVVRLPFPSGDPTFALAGEHNSEALSPRLGLDYRWTPDVMTYVSVAQGAKNGGFNGQTARPSDFDEFDDEVVWTYEAGLRSDLFGGRARLNATLFHSEYQDLQLQINGSTVVNDVPAPFNVITNVPEASIRGGELELTVVPIEHWTLTSGLGLTYGQYDELPTDPEFVASGVITKDSEFSHMPEVSYTQGVGYTRALSNGLGVAARLDYAYRSKIFYNAENTPNVVQPAYGLLNARLTIETPMGLSVSLFGTNLTDEVYIVGGYDDAANPNPGLGFSFVTQGPPRELGISAQFRF
jgi:iron complex outermembrane receptor protein